MKKEFILKHGEMALLSSIFHIFKKGDKYVASNYEGITLINVIANLFSIRPKKKFFAQGTWPDKCRRIGGLFFYQSTNFRVKKSRLMHP